VVENSAATGLPAWVALSRSQRRYLVGMLTGGFADSGPPRRKAPVRSGEGLRVRDVRVRLSDGGCWSRTASRRSGTSPACCCREEQSGGLTYAMNLPGSVHHLLRRVDNIEAGPKCAAVPYRGSTQMLTDALGGRVDVMIDPDVGAAECRERQAAPASALSSPKRFALGRHSGDPPRRCRASSRFVLGLAMAAGTPAAIARELNVKSAPLLDPAGGSAQVLSRRQCADADQPGRDAHQIASEIGAGNGHRRQAH